MSWADKALAKYRKQQQTEKLCDEILNSKQYKAEIEKRDQDAVTHAYGVFLIISCAYLRDKLHFGPKRLSEFLNYATEQMHFSEEYDDYFISMNNALKTETGIDILSTVGLTIEKQQQTPDQPNQKQKG